MATVPSREFGRGKAAQKENQSRHLKGLSVANNKGRETRAQKRTVLGSITNVRVQPSRAAKIDGRQDENAGIQQKVFSAKPKNQPFSIYVDDEAPAFPRLPASSKAVGYQYEDTENHAPSLEEAVACLPVIPPPVPVGSEDASCYLDMSGIEDVDVESEEENVSMTVQEQPMTKAQREAYLEEVPEYSADIYEYLLSVEHRNRPRPGFMKRQEDVTLAMRSILVDWLVEVAEEYKLQRETLFLTVSYIDRFLAQMSVLRSKLQLVGAAAMFLAAKYEEIYPPDVNEFVYITDDTYQKKQILRMEHLILKVLKFDLAMPTINWFGERLLRKTGADSNLINLTMYLCELVLVEYEKFLVFPSSLVAASALCLANYTMGQQEFWSSECERVSCYSLSQLLPCVQLMYDLHCHVEHHPQQAVREKYRLSKYDSVAELSPQPLLCLL
ncbi:G2/mitotic-specific cyclin-A-like [Babylonia areolata]|uniref:G2/mitotic-specific cyclin-A-like n=1 Tax=Babylonia areolata TaxID=304850 RepID=UPI003FD2C90D